MELLQKALFNLPRLASAGGGPPPAQPSPTVATAATTTTDVPQKREYSLPGSRTAPKQVGREISVKAPTIDRLEVIMSFDNACLI